MKLLSYMKDGEISFGMGVDGGIIDIPSCWKGGGAPLSVLEIVEGGADCMGRLVEICESGADIISFDSVSLLSPILRPGKIIALAGNYSQHVKEMGRCLGLKESDRMTTTPRPFLVPSSSLAGHESEIPWPCYSETIDYEVELAVVIGKTVKAIEAEDAMGCVAGYMIANDISARTVTYKEGRSKRPWDEFYDWLSGKWADGFIPMGPYLVTADEAGDAGNLGISLSVNGEIRQEANTSEMIYSVADTISFLSHLMTLEAGDVISTGTPSGVAMATGNYLKGGDVLECRIDNLGVLRNTLGQRPEEFYKPLV